VWEAAVVQRPRTRYANSDGVHIAYQVTGEENPVDLVFAPGSFSHLDLDWDWPGEGEWMDRVSRFARLIRFDKRGTGLSDRVTDAATLEERIDDIRAVMDAAGSKQAVIAGYSEGGNMAMLFAATYPERTRALILSGTQARWWHSQDFPYPVWSLEDYRRIVADLEREGVTDEWLFGAGGGIDGTNAEMRERTYRYAQAAVNPSAVAALERMNMRIDTRSVASAIHVPALVINATNDPVSPVEGARWLADAIPNATLLIFDAATHSGLTDDEEVLARIEEFVTGVRPAPPTDRVLATVLFTNIVGSTETAARLGDRKWSALLDEHHRRTRQQLQRYRGQEMKTTGDGFLATFDGPERGVRCANDICRAVEPIGISIRAGLHTGEVVRSGDDISGIAVHLAARIMALAPSGSVLVSRTVRDLVAGSPLQFADAGTHQMKGIDGGWQVYKLSGVSPR
jgi:class 3 adenylate cyclase